jgi:hypothetical protein
MEKNIRIFLLFCCCLLFFLNKNTKHTSHSILNCHGGISQPGKHFPCHTFTVNLSFLNRKRDVTVTNRSSSVSTVLRRDQTEKE